MVIVHERGIGDEMKTGIKRENNGRERERENGRPNEMGNETKNIAERARRQV